MEYKGGQNIEQHYRRQEHQRHKQQQHRTRGDQPLRIVLLESHYFRSPRLPILRDPRLLSLFIPALATKISKSTEYVLGILTNLFMVAVRKELATTSLAEEEYQDAVQLIPYTALEEKEIQESYPAGLQSP